MWHIAELSCKVMGVCQQRAVCVHFVSVCILNTTPDAPCKILSEVRPEGWIEFKQQAKTSYLQWKKSSRAAYNQWGVREKIKSKW